MQSYNMAYPTNPIYKLLKDATDNRDVCVMKKDGDNTMYIPINKGASDNADFIEYKKWCDAGNTAEAAD